jgi:2-desacetyl-2-hydroxyethyl bacteriochlorophyllide A dehydrogenase
MRAAVLTGPGTLEVRDVPRPTPGPGDHLVSVLEAGICGTDLKILSGAVPVDHPRILGHEAIGVVLEAPEGSPLPVGGRVLLDPSVACGLCVRCRRGDAHLCGKGGLMGRELDGVFAEQVVAPAARLLPVPDHIPVEHGPLLQVLGTCVHGQSLVRADPGQVAVVIGLGVSGLLQAQLLRARGVDTVIGVTRSEEKQRLAIRLGADVAVGPAEAADVVGDLTRGEGADLVVESSGAYPALLQAVDLVRAGGTLLLFGIISGETPDFPFYRLYHKEATVVNPRAALPRDYAAGIDLVARGRLDVGPILDRRFTLDEAADALAVFRDAPGALKVTLRVAG